MGGSQSNAVPSNIEVCDVGEADRKPPTRSRTLLVIIKADRGRVVEEEVSIDLGQPKNEANKSCLELKHIHELYELRCLGRGMCMTFDYQRRARGGQDRIMATDEL